MSLIDPPLSNITVIGLGKIGLTIAAVIANNNFNVYGADINKKIVDTVNEGHSHVKNEPGLAKLLKKAHKNQTLTATSNTSKVVSQSEIVMVIVPVLIDKQNNIDYTFIDSAVESIATGIKRGTLIIFETTLPTGDTRRRFGKKIEEISGLRAGEDFYLAYSPERVYSNQIIKDLKNYPKVVGGINKKSLELASAFYQKALDCKVIEVSSLETAEFSKVAECIYRDVNIALANELAKFADQQNITMSEVIVASNSQPFSHLHFPGIGVGGHCIPIYPYFFINRGLNKGLIQLARSINDTMPEYALEKIENIVKSLKNKNILILGLAFRENVKEVTKSATLLLINQLKHKRANIFLNDPLFTDSEIMTYNVKPLSLDSEIKSKIDIIILQAFHKQYENLNFKEFTNCKFILDGRNILNKEDIQKLGIVYQGIGN